MKVQSADIYLQKGTCFFNEKTTLGLQRPGSTEEWKSH